MSLLFILIVKCNYDTYSDLHYIHLCALITMSMKVHFIILTLALFLIASFTGIDHALSLLPYEGIPEERYLSDAIVVESENDQKIGVVNELYSSLITNLTQMNLFLNYKNSSTSFNLPLYLTDPEK